MNTSPSIPKNSIVFHHGQLRTTSIKLAEAFSKRHDDILKKIKSLDCSEQFTARNFAVSEYKDSTGRKLTMYEMTKDGFMFLVMGFTGKKAAQVKEAYINAFNEMAERLERPALSDAVPKLTPPQQRHIQHRVSELANLPGGSYKAVWGSIKDRFQVGTYKDIPAHQYPDLCRYLGIKPRQHGNLLPPRPDPILKGDRSFGDAQVLCKELRHRLPPEDQHLAEELERCLVQGFTVVDEAIPRMNSALHGLRRWRGAL